MKKYSTVLTIAGSDSGGGAGIQADIKAASACGCYAMSAITALTAQNTLGVSGICPVPAGFVRQQARAVLEDIGADALKLGMLPSAEIVDTVADLIGEYRIANIVLDPVMIATSGDRLIDRPAVERIVTRLLPLARVVTPNIPEAEFISGLPLGEPVPANYERIAGKFSDMGAKAVLIKSGHAEGELVTDYLYDFVTGSVHGYPYRKIHTSHTHGTGCTLSSAVAAFLARGYGLPEAVERAEDYVRRAILSGADYTTGSGHGPVDHFFMLRNEN